MKRFKMPTAYAILAGLIVAVAVATWVVPTGQYDYVDGAPVAGEFVPDPEMEAEIAEKEQQALEKLGMADPTPAPESAGAN